MLFLGSILVPSVPDGPGVFIRNALGGHLRFATKMFQATVQLKLIESHISRWEQGHID